MSLTKNYLWCATLAHKLARTTVGGLLGLAFACWGLSSCGEDDSVTESVTAEGEAVVEVTDRYVGDSVYFKIGDTFHAGAVLEGVSADEVKVRLDDRSEKVVSIDRIRGTLLADHADIGVVVKLLGDRNKGESTLNGEIVGVYDDGMRKIEIFSISHLGGGGERLDVYRIRFAHRDTDYARGGYLTLDEFARFVRNGVM